MLVDMDCTIFMGKHSKELEIWLFNLINDSQHDFLKSAIKIYR